MNDDELRARLRAADPARNLTSSGNLELTEAQMSTNPSPARPNRARMGLVAAAAAVLLLAGVGVVVGLVDDDKPSPSATPGGDGTTTKPTPATTPPPTYVFNPGVQAARCMAPTPGSIRNLDAAFTAVVTARTDNRVELEIKRGFKAPKAKQVVINVRKAENAHYEALPVKFEVGKEYIVGIQKGVVRLCGFTAEKSPELEQRYARTFAKR